MTPFILHPALSQARALEDAATAVASWRGRRDRAARARRRTSRHRAV
jgi:hypothetical protein